MHWTFCGSYYVNSFMDIWPWNHGSWHYCWKRSLHSKTGLCLSQQHQHLQIECWCLLPLHASSKHHDCLTVSPNLLLPPSHLCALSPFNSSSAPPLALLPLLPQLTLPPPLACSLSLIAPCCGLIPTQLLPLAPRLSPLHSTRCSLLPPPSVVTISPSQQHSQLFQLS